MQRRRGEDAKRLGGGNGGHDPRTEQQLGHKAKAHAAAKRRRRLLLLVLLVVVVVVVVLLLVVVWRGERRDRGGALEGRDAVACEPDAAGQPDGFGRQRRHVTHERAQEELRRDC